MLCTSILPLHSALMYPILLFSTASPSLIRLLITLIKEQLHWALNSWRRPCQGYAQVLSVCFVLVLYIYPSLPRALLLTAIIYHFSWRDTLEPLTHFAHKHSEIQGPRSLDPLKQPIAQGHPTPLPWGGTNSQDAVYTLGFPKGSAENRTLPASVPSTVLSLLWPTLLLSHFSWSTLLIISCGQIVMLLENGS